MLPFAPTLPIQAGVPYCTLSSDTTTTWSDMKNAWEATFELIRQTLILFSTFNRQQKDTKTILAYLNYLLQQASEGIATEYPRYYIRLFVQNSQGVIRASGSSDPENAPIGDPIQWRADVSNAFAINLPTFASSVRGSASVSFKLSYYLAYPVVYDSVCGAPATLILRLTFTVK